MKEKALRGVLKKLAIPVDREENGWLICACPFAQWRHKSKKDNTPSFGVSITKDRSGFSCWSCHEHGSLPNLAFKLARLRKTPELVEFGRKIERDQILGSEEEEIDFGGWGDGLNKEKEKAKSKVIFPDEADLYAKYGSVFDYSAGLRYLRERGIHPPTIAKLGLRYDPRQERVLLPVYDYWTGRFAGFTGRTIWTERHRKSESIRLSERYGRRIKIPKVRDYGGLNKIALLLGPRALRLGRIRGRSTGHSLYESFILVEGLFAYLHLTQLGYVNCAALLGSRLTPEKADIVKDINRPTYWLTDPDVAGRSCLYGPYNFETEEFEGGGALEMLHGDVAQLILEYPEDVDDVDNLTGPQLKYMIEKADLWIGELDKRY